MSSEILAEWIAAANAHDASEFLAYFTEDAVLDDPSVGEVYEGRDRIGEYYQSYFIGYDTRTELVGTEQRGDVLHVEVAFTGSFPGGQTNGIFDLTFSGRQIQHARADLI
ncbi:nuclear transport factor 2 family protein [Kribbella sp. NPDC051770]|uniref:YybH family protein n=1 Tax=Kribbella sp. NPDC051770 TaxID=3155413 RepID=UPI00343F2949